MLWRNRQSADTAEHTGDDKPRPAQPHDDDITAAESSDTVEADNARSHEHRSTTPSPDAAASLPSSPPAQANGRQSLVVSSILLVVISWVAGWLAYQAAQADAEAQTEARFVETAKQVALQLGNISADTVDADSQRIVDMSTGSFLADFKQRRPAFIDFVHAARSKSEATIHDAGLESVDNGHARVLVALGVKVAAPSSQTAEPPGSWRLRITVQSQSDGDPKVSHVEFVP